MFANESADYCMLVNEWALLRLQVCLLSLKVHLGSIFESELKTEMKIWCVLASSPGLPRFLLFGLRSV